jgi:hypothetical protein
MLISSMLVASAAAVGASAMLILPKNEHLDDTIGDDPMDFISIFQGHWVMHS